MGWNDILGIVEFIGNICVIIITVYTFYLGFVSRRVSIVTAGWNLGNNGDYLTILLKNHSLRTISIRQIDCVFNDRYKIRIGEWRVPLVLEPFGSLRIDMESFSYLHNHKINDFINHQFYAIAKTVNGK